MKTQHMDRLGPGRVSPLLSTLRRRQGVANLGLKTRGIRRKLGRRPPPQLFPGHIVQTYFTDLRRFLNVARDMVERELLPQLPGLVRLGFSERGEAPRNDAVGDDVDRTMDVIARRFWDQLGVNRLEQLGRRRQATNLLEISAGDTAHALAQYQKTQLDKQLRAQLGIDLNFLNEPNLGGQIQAFTKTNVSLIKSVPQQFFDQVEARVITGVSAGDRPASIANDIADRFGVAESRAALIANDQVGKFFGKLNEVRQTALGIDGYIWRTVADDRVRLTHRAHDGQLFQWSDPPVDTGHPGEDYNCRCYPEPNVAPILDSL